MKHWKVKMSESNLEQLKGNVHAILAYSYAFYFIAFIIGLFLDFLFPVKIFNQNSVSYFGFILLILSSVLIFWAQKSSRNLEKETLTKKSFCKGPYCFTRTPTHWGLFLLMLSFAILVNTFFIVIFTIISFFITKFIFLRKQEEMLVKKYGDPYKEYRKTVIF